MEEKLYLGIEFGSTRIKSVMIDGQGTVRAIGQHVWENELKNGLWTYAYDAVGEGLRASFADCVKAYGKTPTIAAMGISGMMHGYLPLDRNGEPLVPFRTWRNTNTGASAAKLTKLFGENIPLRWSIAHLYQAILNNEPHLKDLCRITTLAGYVHEKLTGESVLGAGEASGCFPLLGGDYNKKYLKAFGDLIKDKGYPWTIEKILPRVLTAGECAGKLTEEGARFIDPTGMLKAGIPFCPPEGDAGTGMVATNSVLPQTGNVSAGTSSFAMVVLSEPLKQMHETIDMVTTPDGKPVAMVHCNNCTSDLNAWGNVLSQFASRLGQKVSLSDALTALFDAAKEGTAEGLVGYNFLSGEPVAGLNEGRPLFARLPQGKMTFADFAKAQLYSCVAALAYGMEALWEENVQIKEMCGHGGFFKSPESASSVMSAALRSPVTVWDTAGEGGAYGMAVLALYMGKKESLPAFLDKLFASAPKTTRTCSKEEREHFDNYMALYRKGLAAEKAAVETLQ
ncbi:MAG: ATPase [Clostridiales bacterium]|nr:ATPase [Clostridiales bacterium]